MKKETNITAKEQKMRGRIIGKALNLMSKKGIEQVSMREIAQSIGVSKPVLYYYFENKEELCKSIIDEAVKDYSKKLEVAYKGGTQLDDLITMALQNQMDFFGNNKKIAAFVLHLMSYSFAGKKGSEAFLNDRKCKRREFETLLNAEEKKGAFADGSRKDFEVLVSALSSYVMFNTFFPDGPFDRSMPVRLVKIIKLGLHEYYKGNKK